MPHRVPQVKGHVVQIGIDIRLRTQLYMNGAEVSRFAVSLEADVGSDAGGWRRVACCDNWGGTTHVVTYRPDGTDLVHHKNAFHSDDIHVSVQWARDYLMDNSTRLVREFRALL